MSTDAIHGLTGLLSAGLITSGAWLAWGPGYALLTLGAILLCAVVTARKGVTDARDTDDAD